MAVGIDYEIADKPGGNSVEIDADEMVGDGQWKKHSDIEYQLLCERE
jgi:hypothetical protein